MILVNECWLSGSTSVLVLQCPRIYCLPNVHVLFLGGEHPTLRGEPFTPHAVTGVREALTLTSMKAMVKRRQVRYKPRAPGDSEREEEFPFHLGLQRSGP